MYSKRFGLNVIILAIFFLFYLRNITIATFTVCQVILFLEYVRLIDGTKRSIILILFVVLAVLMVSITPPDNVPRYDLIYKQGDYYHLAVFNGRMI